VHQRLIAMMLAASESAGGGGGGGSWSFSKTITIDHTKAGSADTTDYPLLFSSTIAGLKTVANGGSVQSVSGYDIAFFSDSGLTTMLDFEVEKWDATTGELVAWVRVPTLSHTVDTVIYLGYGNASIVASQEDVAGTWDAGFSAVYHFIAGAGTNPVITRRDSTANANNLTAIDAKVDQVTGKVAGGITTALDSQAPMEAVGSASSLNLAGNLTVEAWVKPPNYATYRGFLAKADDTSPNSRNYSLFVAQTTGYAYFSLTQSRVTRDLFGTSALSTSAFSHVVGTYDGANMRVYVNGVEEGSLAVTGAIDTFSARSLTIGCLARTPLSPAYPLSGEIDEPRVSSVARSASYVTATYNNVSSPSTFYAVT
jgi:hypothetical protein